MAEKTIYCAQAFWRRMGKLCGGQVHHFSTEERAVAGGEALFTGAHGVAVFSVTGHPDIDLWEEPRMLETFGEVPTIDPAPPDEIQYFRISCSAAGDTWTQIDSAGETEQDEEAA